jgi:hypothetical protein
MTISNKFFNSKYPIAEALMNGGSSLNLALAVHEAGAMPSVFSRSGAHPSSPEEVEEETYYCLKEFTTVTGCSNIIIRLGLHDLKLPGIIKIIQEFQPSHIELFHVNELEFIRWNVLIQDPMISAAIKWISRYSKLVTRIDDVWNQSAGMHGFYMMGKSKSGRQGKYTFDEFVIKQKQNCPKVSLIAEGGIGTSGQIKHLLDIGVSAVSIGALFAASQESPLSDAAKQALVKSSSENLITFSDTQRSTICFGDIEPIEQSKSNWNRSDSLYTGIKGDAQQGHIYMGKSIDYICKILPVKQIVENLVSELELYK